MPETLAKGLQGEVGKILKEPRSVFGEPWDVEVKNPDPVWSGLRATQNTWKDKF